MAIAWFICLYKRRISVFGAHVAIRYTAMDDFTLNIGADGGVWSETEVLGNQAVVKVRASVATFATIAATAGFRRLPVDRLNDSLSSLSVAEKLALRTVLTDAGYTLAEVQAALGTDLGTRTLGDVLRFMATRRLKPRYDVLSDTFVLDGAVQACRSVESVDAEVQ